MSVTNSSGNNSTGEYKTSGNGVIIFDTTLRDGEQSLRASLTPQQKLTLAQAIARLNVDVMELGFPVSSQGDFSAIEQISKTIKQGPVLCGLARALPNDIEICAQALSTAERFRIHTFIATSPVHLKYKLGMTFPKALEQAVKSIEYARRFTSDIEFSCEDASRTPIDDLCRIVEAAINAGANTINLPDTVGYALPYEMSRMVSQLRNRVPNIDKAILSVHCHNDLGLAVANSIAAVESGARQIECTVNGIGERAGNCALEEVVMILNTRKAELGFNHHVTTNEIKRCSKLVSHLCNMPVQPNKAIVGEHAFAHSSGIHQDGVLKSTQTYEIIEPKSVGVEQHDFSITARSGRHVLKYRMLELGYQADEFDLDALYESVMQLADRKGQLYDYDLEALVMLNQSQLGNNRYQLEFLQTATNQGITVKGGRATATIGLSIDGSTLVEAATGEGPVEAAFSAIQKITDMNIHLERYNLSAKGKGADALGQVDLVASVNKQQFHGTGIAPDVVEASVNAYINVLNLVEQAKQVAQKKQQQPQTPIHTPIKVTEVLQSQLVTIDS